MFKKQKTSIIPDIAFLKEDWRGMILCRPSSVVDIRVGSPILSK